MLALTLALACLAALLMTWTLAQFAHDIQALTDIAHDQAQRLDTLEARVRQLDRDLTRTEELAADTHRQLRQLTSANANRLELDELLSLIGP
jgi:type II secretory pathway component PulJ